MNTQELLNTASALFKDGKGLLAMDESTGTCNKRFKAAGIPQTVEYRRAYRELIVTTPGLNQYLSGAILFDETIYQSTEDGTLFIDILKREGIIPGIKVDESTMELAGFPGEKITKGIDGLPERLTNYYHLGARFAKWRAVITIGKGIPTDACIEANTHLLARYAAMCQQADIVPIVEPEVLMDGDHDLQTCLNVTKRTLHSLFKQLYQQNVYLPGLVLKPNMVVSGKDAAIQANVEEVADATINCFLETVPAAVTGIAFLSGGQSPEIAAAHLNAMEIKYRDIMPWGLTFSFSRAIQQPALEYWAGKPENVKQAQQLLAYRAKLASAATQGEYSSALEQ